MAGKASIRRMIGLVVANERSEMAGTLWFLDDDIGYNFITNIRSDVWTASNGI